MSEKVSPQYSDKQTKALRNFAHTFLQTEKIETILVELQNIAYRSHIIHRLFSKLRGIEFQAQEEIDKIEETLREYEEQYPILREMLFVHRVNTFLTYFSDVLLEVYLKRPESLRSNRQITYEEVLSYDSKDKLIEALAKNLVSEVSYKSFSEICDYYNSKLKVEVCSDDEQEKQIGTAIEIRNILVHNRGFVNDVFLERVKDSSFALGSRIKVDDDVLDEHSKLLWDRAYAVDAQVVEKFFKD